MGARQSSDDILAMTKEAGLPPPDVEKCANGLYGSGNDFALRDFVKLLQSKNESGCFLHTDMVKWLRFEPPDYKEIVLSQEVIKQDIEEPLIPQGKKPLLFLEDIDMRYLGMPTLGDRKPLLILAVIAARSSPVTIWYNVLSEHRFLKRFAKKMLGPTWYENLILKTYSPYDFWNIENQKKFYKELKQYFVFSYAGSGVADVELDFGFSSERNRFVSCLLSSFRPNTPHFGSLYLPLNQIYSPKLDHLQAFRNAHISKKIMLLAGSLRMPYDPKIVVDWLNKNKESQWAFIFISSKMQPISNQNILYLQDYVEFEDLVRFGDCFVGNCGAGSTILPLAAGLPVACSFGQGEHKLVGQDKLSNLESISPDNLNVGPGSTKSFAELMAKFDANFDIYRSNAERLVPILKSERKQMLHNMQTFFTRLSTDEDFQLEIQKTKFIPAEYALPPCDRLQSQQQVAKRSKK